ncbi:MAG: DUF5071 domain-containing protein [Lysinibacillus sp.]
MDKETLDRLKQATAEEVAVHIPGLLKAVKKEELQEEAVELLKQHPTESTVHIEAALLADDVHLQGILLRKIVPVLPFYSKMVVANAVEHIASAPGELQLLAKEALQSFEP